MIRLAKAVSVLAIRQVKQRTDLVIGSVICIDSTLESIC